MALDAKKFRKEWMGGLGKHVAGSALADRLKKKHGPKAEPMADEGTPPESEEIDAPMAHSGSEGPTGAPPPMAHMEPDADDMGGPSDGDADNAMGEACPHCAQPMPKKPMPMKKPGHHLDHDSLQMLLRSRGG